MNFSLEPLVQELESIEQLLATGDIYSDQKKMKEIMIRKKHLAPIVKMYHEYQKSTSDLEEAKKMLGQESDEEMREMAKLEIIELENSLPLLAEKLKIALIPPDPNDEKNVILEIRAGAGGDEAGLFGAELAESYKLFATKHKFQIETMSESRNDADGIKEIIMKIS